MLCLVMIFSGVFMNIFSVFGKLVSILWWVLVQGLMVLINIVILCLVSSFVMKVMWCMLVLWFFLEKFSFLDRFLCIVLLLSSFIVLLCVDSFLNRVVVRVFLFVLERLVNQMMWLVLLIFFFCGRGFCEVGSEGEVFMCLLVFFYCLVWCLV